MYINIVYIDKFVHSNALYETLELLHDIKENLRDVLQFPPELLILQDLPVGADLLQSELLQLPGLEPVGENQHVGNEFHLDLL